MHARHIHTHTHTHTHTDTCTFRPMPQHRIPSDPGTSQPCLTLPRPIASHIIASRHAAIKYAFVLFIICSRFVFLEIKLFPSQRERATDSPLFEARVAERPLTDVRGPLRGPPKYMYMSNGYIYIYIYIHIHQTYIYSYICIYIYI